MGIFVQRKTDKQSKNSKDGAIKCSKEISFPTLKYEWRNIPLLRSKTLGEGHHKSLPVSSQLRFSLTIKNKKNQVTDTYDIMGPVFGMDNCCINLVSLVEPIIKTV